MGKLAQQRALRQGELSRLRLEFEEFVHERIEKVLEGVEDMKQNERYDDSTQKEKIEAITSEVDRLKSGLYTVQLSWSRLVSQGLSADLSMVGGSRYAAADAPPEE